MIETDDGPKSCLVPQCGNSTSKTPNKKFVAIPNVVKVRRKWFQAMKHNQPPITGITLQCCEDHFDLEKDAQDYTQFKETGILHLKDNVVPHKFHCQKNADSPELGSNMVKKVLVPKTTTEKQQMKKGVVSKTAKSSSKETSKNHMPKNNINEMTKRFKSSIYDTEFVDCGSCEDILVRVDVDGLEIPRDNIALGTQEINC